MTIFNEAIQEDALKCLGDLHRNGRHPVAELAYFRSVQRRLREGKESLIKLR